MFAVVGKKKGHGRYSVLLSRPFSWQVFLLRYFSWKSGRNEIHAMYVSKASSSQTGNVLRVLVDSFSLAKENMKIFSA